MPARNGNVTEKCAVVRTRTFSGIVPEEVLTMLRGEKFTGRLTIDMSQGGSSTVQVEDRAHAPYLTPANNSM